MIKKYSNFFVDLYDRQGKILIGAWGIGPGYNTPEPLKIEAPRKNELLNFRRVFECESNKLAPLGKSLYDKFFVPEVAKDFEGWVNKIRARDEEGLRLCIRTKSNALIGLTWEILCNQIDPFDNFLALDCQTPIVRAPQRVAKSISRYDLREMTLPLRMLTVLASPTTLPNIRRKEEEESLEDALGKSLDEGHILLEPLGFKNRNGASFNELQKHLEQPNADLQYHIVHIIAHGPKKLAEGKFIKLVSNGGRSDQVNAVDLANLFRKNGVMLVVLQSCMSGAINSADSSYSGVAQQLVVSGVPAVLAMQEPIHQNVARKFINCFFTAWIGRKCSFEEALTNARINIHHHFKNRVASWAIPVVYLLPGVELKPKKEAATFESEKQVLDAALPRLTRVNKKTELIVMIRQYDKPGLESVLGEQPDEFDPTPEDVKSSVKFDLQFPIDQETKEALPINLKIEVETDDFDLTEKEDTIQIQPRNDDGHMRFFPLIPKEEGIAKLTVRVRNVDNVMLSQLRLSSSVRSGETFATGYYVTTGDYLPTGECLGGGGEGYIIEEKIETRILDDFSNIFKRYDLDLEVTGEARAVSKDATMQAIAQFVVDGDDEGILPAVKKALESKSPLDIINEALIAGMNEVSRLWDEGVYFLPQVILSSEAMNVGIAECEAKMGKAMDRKSTVVTHTAEGDIHDIGQVIVNALLNANGFKVVNLGADVPVEKVVAACKEHRPVMVTGTALMTTTMTAFPKISHQLKAAGLDIPFICGGGAVCEEYVSGYDLGIWGKEASQAPGMAEDAAAGESWESMRSKWNG